MDSGHSNDPTRSSPSEPLPTPPSNSKPPRRIRADLRSDEVIKGSHPGDRYVRYGRRSGTFRRRGGGMLAATLETSRPRGRWGRFFGIVRRVFIGAPIPSEHAIHERLTNLKALAILSSDALSSVAYATEEIILILIAAGIGALAWSVPLGLGVMALMAIVVTSYRQTVAAYPRGGGTYIVAKDNLGTLPGLAAASSILIGYTLTVAVSVAAGVAAIYSLYPAVQPYRVEVCIGVVLFITVANLRGLREAGNIFAVPTYLFIFGILAMIGYGLVRLFFEVGGPMIYEPPVKTLVPQTLAPLTILLLMQAFTQGSAALTGVEAIADGVPAFRPPEWKNARLTLLYMGALSIFMFGGITYLASQLQILPSSAETVVSQLARTIFGRNWLWYFIQIVTALILVLAANTAFADFPRLSYFLARDKFMPHQYSFRGERLAFSWGIVTLATLAGILIIAYNGDTSALIPLYAIGVMGAFTFSQSGMVARWWRLRPPGWQRNMVLNGVGAVTTLVVFLIATFTKLEKGTWLVLVMIPVQMLVFSAINRHYTRVAREMAVEPGAPRPVYRHTFIVPVSSINRVSLVALDYARSLSPDVTAVHIVEGEDPAEAREFREQWRLYFPNDEIELVLIESPYRSLVAPLLTYIDALDRQDPGDTITVVVSEAVPASPWEYVLHYQTALRLKASLLFRPNTIVTDVPYRLSSARGYAAGQSPSSFWVRLGTIPWIPIIVLLLLLLGAYLLIFART